MITILISTSPRPSHPSTRVIDQTVVSVRAQLPHAPIIIMADGVEDDADRSAHIRYAGFLAEISGRYDNCTVLDFLTHHHQSGMISRALELVKTPLILYLEDDWTFTTYPPVKWDALMRALNEGKLNYIKLHAQNRIHPLHAHMMGEWVIWDEVAYILTRQWSQNPHLARVDFYQSAVVPRCVGQRDYIENIMHGPVQAGDWGEWEMAIYNPIEGSTMQVVQHINGDQE